MVQEFFILKCYSCDIFQVHIVKKRNHWTCKVCDAKQSIIKVYEQGSSAKDCRLRVQTLNELRKGKEEIANKKLELDQWNMKSKENIQKRSKWSFYLTNDTSSDLQFPQVNNVTRGDGKKWKNSFVSSNANDEESGSTIPKKEDISNSFNALFDERFETSNYTSVQNSRLNLKKENSNHLALMGYLFSENVTGNFENSPFLFEDGEDALNSLLDF